MVFFTPEEIAACTGVQKVIWAAIAGEMNRLGLRRNDLRAHRGGNAAFYVETTASVFNRHPEKVRTMLLEHLEKRQSDVERLTSPTPEDVARFEKNRPEDDFGYDLPLQERISAQLRLVGLKAAMHYYGVAPETGPEVKI